VWFGYICDIASPVEDGAGVRGCLALASHSPRVFGHGGLTLDSISARPTETSKSVSPFARLYKIHSSRASTAASRCVAGEERYAGRWEGILLGDMAVLRAVGDEAERVLGAGRDDHHGDGSGIMWGEGQQAGLRRGRV